MAFFLHHLFKAPRHRGNRELLSTLHAELLLTQVLQKRRACRFGRGPFKSPALPVPTASSSRPTRHLVNYR
jgi:hypothetical protein